MFQPLLDAFIESAPIKKKLPLNLPPPPHLRVNYDRLLQNASPLLELSQNTTFKIYRKAYQKSLPLLRAVRRWVKKMGL
ncbi:alpha-1,3-fucosyl transferase [Helicobacter pylori 2017]|nr:alpha-1,3-fucosyl transferase [Helicobacter pylori 2017]